MPECASCSAELRPEWKYCIYCGTPTVPGALRPEPSHPARVNTLAVIALVLGLVGGAPALIFGHLALRQIRAGGERGRVIAVIGTVLGYLWLVVWVIAGGTLLFNAL
jgi:hypothetical protein